MDKLEIRKFLDILKKGYTLVYKPYYQEHLLFCLFHLEDLSKQMAHNGKRKRTKLEDLMNAFSMLNGVIRFP